MGYVVYIYTYTHMYVYTFRKHIPHIPHLPPNQFDELHLRGGYEKKCLCNGCKGYIVKVADNLNVKQYEDIINVLKTDGTDITF